MPALTNEAIADLWRASHESLDFTAVAQLASPDMRTWHSNDNVWLSVEEVVARNMAAKPETKITSMSPPKVTVTEAGFILQMTVEKPGLGMVHVVQVITVADGQIISCEEYIAPEMEVPSSESARL